MTAHLIAQFAAYARLHHEVVHQGHGDLGSVLWVQPRHGASWALAFVRGHVISWVGRR